MDDEPTNCANCGSEDIYWEPGDGWCCNECGASDSDET